MRGEFIGVWSETWREVWQPLAEHEAAASDMFCQLYAELALVRRTPSHDEIRSLILEDDTLAKEAFDRAIVLCGTDIDADRDLAYYGAVAFKDEAEQVNEAIEGTLAEITGDQTRSKQAWDEALTALINDQARVAGLLEKSLANVLNDVGKSREAFERTRAEHLTGERTLVRFLESAHETLFGIGGDLLANRYFNLLKTFIEKYSLRYELRAPCTLCPTLPGLFASLIRDLRTVASQDAHINTLMRDFEDSIRDLATDNGEGRIKICIQRQMNLLEGIGRNCPGVTGTTLGVVCDQVGTWPHERIRDAMKNLYTFASDYPGIRHAGTPANALRNIEMRDMVALSILLAGFSPYLTNLLDADMIYRGV